MAYFYKLFRCFAKPILIDGTEYHKILDFIFTKDGIAMGLFNGFDAAEEINMASSPHPDEILCCCCCCCFPSSCIKFDP